MQADEARCSVLMNIARVLATGRVVGDSESKGLVMSMVPMEYWEKFEVRREHGNFNETL